MTILKKALLGVVFLTLFACKDNLAKKPFIPGEIWLDSNEEPINAHGGGMLFHNDTYYWFGEHKNASTGRAMVGISCYSSKDLHTWKNRGIALPVVMNDDNHDIAQGCTMERPKVIYNDETKQFVMWFHLELKGKGYTSARCAVAISEKVNGPYKYIRSERINAGITALNTTEKELEKYALAYKKFNQDSIKTKKGRRRPKLAESGVFYTRDLKGGQMSRDMTLFVDDDKKAYHIYSSEDNQTLQIAELSTDYTSHSGKYIRILAGGRNEAPAIFKHNNKYWLISSGCTGWKSNAARLSVAENIMGDWETVGNPCIGEGRHNTFDSQSTYILPVAGKEDCFIFMADRWKAKELSDSRYIWLPISFDNQGFPQIEWHDEWSIATL